jgi:UDP-2,3-diacylglucosamine pyrophosphatase LpxH
MTSTLEADHVAGEDAMYRPSLDRPETQKELHDTLILSDLHLGSEMSRAREAIHLLESLEYRQLILLGDIFSDLNFSRLTGDHWKFLGALRKLSNPKRQVKVVWVEGNHDEGLSKIMSHLVGIPVYRRYVWEYEGKRHLAIHGHQFDRFVSRNLLISRIGVEIYHYLQMIDSPGKFVTRHMDRFNTRWLRLTEKVAIGALTYAKMGHVDRVFCGHTHVADERSKDGVQYFNTGSWVDETPTYITVSETGVRINIYEGAADESTAYDRYSGQERGLEPATASDLFEQAGLPALAAFESVRC